MHASRLRSTLVGRVQFMPLVPLLLLASAVSVPAAAAADPDFSCPSPPSGWSSPQGPQFWGPDQEAGGDTERITCIYDNSKGLAESVVVSYALPTDLNPFNDFYFGCGTNGTMAWNETQRVYGATSADRWIYANFSDPLGTFTTGDVPKFEAVARSMMDKARDLAHTCSFKAASIETSSGWLFDFNVELRGKDVVARLRIGTHVSQKLPGIGSYAIPDASFETKGTADHPLVASLSAPPVPIAVVAHGKRHTVTVELVKGTSFSYKVAKDGTSTISTLVTDVKVVRSTLAGCPRGSTGTLSLATAPGVASVRLGLCSAALGTLSSRSAHVEITRT